MPGTVPQWLAASAVGLSAINLSGGTIVTAKMLDMFKRPDDPPEFNHYYLLPGAAAVAGSGALFATGLNPPSLAPMLALGSALGCDGGISCLSHKTQHLGYQRWYGWYRHWPRCHASCTDPQAQYLRSASAVWQWRSWRRLSCCAAYGPTDFPRLWPLSTPWWV